MNGAISAKTKLSMPAAKIIISILLLMIVVTFAVQNMSMVPITYYDLHFQKLTLEVPILVVILGSLLTGFVLAWFVGAFKQMRMRSQLRKSERTVQSLTSKIEKYKSEE